MAARSRKTNTANLLTFVVVCKGRLAHLQQSLPPMLAQANTATVVVEVECPDGTAEWVAANHPQAQLVRHVENGGFNLSRARNAGLAAVTTPWMMFIDADIVIAADFMEKVAPQLVAGRYHRFDSAKGPSIYGSNIVETLAARKIGGYDEAFEGWGGEDTDFYDRLDVSGVSSLQLGSSVINRIINHPTEVRTRFYRERNIALSQTTNTLYRVLKRKVARLSPITQLDLPLRKTIYRVAQQAVERAAVAPDHAVEFQMELPADPDIQFRLAELEQRITLRLTLAPHVSKTQN